MITFKPINNNVLFKDARKIPKNYPYKFLFQPKLKTLRKMVTIRAS